MVGIGNIYACEALFDSHIRPTKKASRITKKETKALVASVKKVLKKAKGYTGARSKRLRAAKEQVMHAGADSFTHRKDKKSDYRKLWISRINAASRQHDLAYSKFINGLNNAGIKVDRKILADLAVNDPKGFKKLVDLAKKNLNA